MVTRKIFSRLIGISLVAAFILSSCSAARTTAAPVTLEASPTSPIQVASNTEVPTNTSAPTATPVPTATATAAPVATATQAATLPAVSTATAISPLTAQVIPSMNAYCRKGPGTSYDEITFLASGSAYNVIGRNSLNTWWLVQVPGNLTCWTGAPGTSQLGSVQQAPIVLVPPALLAPSLFVGSYVCDVSTTKHTLSVSLDWALVDKATGYHLYLNGILLAELGPNVTAYHNNAPLNEDLVYELEAFDSYSVSPRVVVRVPSCD